MRIKIFAQTSEALKAYFRLAQILGFPGSITQIIPPSGHTIERGWEVTKVGIENHLTSLDFLNVTFIFRRNLEMRTDLQLREVDITVFDHLNTFRFVGARSRVWSTKLLVDYPVNHEDPYFHPSEVSLWDFRKMFGPREWKSALKHFFLTGELPERNQEST